MEVMEMSDNELKEQLIREYVNIQRLKSSQDRDKELAYQEKVLKVRLQTLGIPTEDLELQVHIPIYKR
ncbi:MAG: hypothetical protein LUC90_01050 [Lachnospiraceae bacterium]|nr:hypothetical protein [Lachnospiraceae bacterium]